MAGRKGSRPKSLSIEIWNTFSCLPGNYIVHTNTYHMYKQKKHIFVHREFHSCHFWTRCYGALFPPVVLISHLWLWFPIGTILREVLIILSVAWNNFHKESFVWLFGTHRPTVGSIEFHFPEISPRGNLPRRVCVSVGQTTFCPHSGTLVPNIWIHYHNGNDLPFRN